MNIFFSVQSSVNIKKRFFSSYEQGHQNTSYTWCCSGPLSNCKAHCGPPVVKFAITDTLVVQKEGRLKVRVKLN